MAKDGNSRNIPNQDELGELLERLQGLEQLTPELAKTMDSIMNAILGKEFISDERISKIEKEIEEFEKEKENEAEEAKEIIEDREHQREEEADEYEKMTEEYMETLVGLTNSQDSIDQLITSFEDDSIEAVLANNVHFAKVLYQLGVSPESIADFIDLTSKIKLLSASPETEVSAILLESDLKAIIHVLDRVSNKVLSNENYQSDEYFNLADKLMVVLDKVMQGGHVSNQDIKELQNLVLEIKMQQLREVGVDEEHIKMFREYNGAKLPEEEQENLYSELQQVRINYEIEDGDKAKKEMIDKEGFHENFVSTTEEWIGEVSTITAFKEFEKRGFFATLDEVDMLLLDASEQGISLENLIQELEKDIEELHAERFGPRVDEQKIESGIQETSLQQQRAADAVVMNESQKGDRNKEVAAMNAHKDRELEVAAMNSDHTKSIAAHDAEAMNNDKENIPPQQLHHSAEPVQPKNQPNPDTMTFAEKQQSYNKFAKDHGRSPHASQTEKLGNPHGSGKIADRKAFFEQQIANQKNSDNRPTR